jgi:hypothetical protein
MISKMQTCNTKSNIRYPYPLFELLSTNQRIAFFTLAAVLVTVSSSGLKWLYGRVNGYQIAQREAHKPLKKVQ